MNRSSSRESGTSRVAMETTADPDALIAMGENIILSSCFMYTADHCSSSTVA